MKPDQAPEQQITLIGLIVFFCTLLLFTWVLLWSDATRKLDRLLHDSWVRSHQRAVPGDVVIAALDSESLNKVGRWPWPRDQQALLFEKLQKLGVQAVIIDLLYAEPSEVAEHDIRLAKAIESLPVSILPVLTEGGAGQIASESLPISVILRSVSDIGHIFLPIDDDGIVRRVFLKSGFNRAHWPALSLAGLNAVGNAPPGLPGEEKDERIQPGQWVENHEVLIPFYGSNGAFQRVSAVDIMRDDVPRGQLADKIVFVGMTTTGLGDVVPTPVSALDQPVPGVEIHANIFSALRDESLVVSAQPNTNLAVALVLLPLMLAMYSRAPPQWGLITAVVGAGVPILLSFALYSYARLWYAPLSASVPILISYLFWSRHRLNYVNQFLENERSKIESHLPQRDSKSNTILASFFQTASRHLPIEGWRFSVEKEVFDGGSGLPDIRQLSNEGGWLVRRGVYSRTYPGRHPLHVELAISNATQGTAITEYVDTLARTRTRDDVAPMLGSVEKLQTNAQKLSEQLDWLRNMKVFSDTILAGSPAGFAVWNAAGECVRANQLTYEMVSNFKELSDLRDFVHCIGRRTDVGEDAQTFQRLVLDSEPWQVPYSEEQRELVVNFRVVGDALADRLICATVLDVTDIRTSERARAEMVDYLSHDLRSPLISALYLLSDDADPKIEQNIHQSLSMMENLLHIARADSLSESRFIPVLMNAVVDNSLDQLLPQALSQSIKFKLDTVDDELWLLGDAAALERAVVNIVGNAIKYSPENTTINIRLFVESQQAVLTVEDQGVGIQPEMIDQLFTRFKRDQSTASQFKGIGLGLAFVSRVVRLHGGRVAASNTGVGTRITLELPLEDSLALDQTVDNTYLAGSG
ncbi:MAG: CHASE2 domain-containing protein [Granulosicoccus sp.]